MWAQTDARIVFLSRQLKSARDPRARAQTALILGASKDASAAGPLCEALIDPEPLVRVAVVNSLEQLEVQAGLLCLEQKKTDASPEVTSAMARAIQSLTQALARKKKMYVAVELAQRDVQVPTEALGQVEANLKNNLVSRGALLAPAQETSAEAQKVLQEKQVKGYLLLTEVQPHGDAGLRLKLLCMTYPDRALRGQVSVKGSGPMAKLIPALVNRAVDDSAQECGWSE